MSVTNIKPWFQVAQTCVFNIQTIANQRQRKSWKNSEGKTPHLQNNYHNRHLNNITKQEWNTKWMKYLNYLKKKPPT